MKKAILQLGFRLKPLINYFNFKDTAMWFAQDFQTGHYQRDVLPMYFAHETFRKLTGGFIRDIRITKLITWG